MQTNGNTCTKVAEIYLDHAATTAVDPRVKAEMDKFFTEEFGNPSSFHAAGLRAREALEGARAGVAQIIGAHPTEIVFTGSGTEAINLAIQGVARALKQKGKHIITTAAEHHAVLETCKYLRREEGFEVTILPVDRDGRVAPKQVEQEIRKDTILVSVIYVNNEIGTINPIAEIGKVCRAKKVYFHVDGCQAAGLLNIDVQNLHCTLLSMNGSKLYGPKGVGVLFKRQGVQLKPIIFGGGQEGGLRSGTENVPYIVAFATALKIAQEGREAEAKRLIQLRDRLIHNVYKSISGARLLGHATARLPNHASFVIPGVEAESLLAHLNEHGILASAGSACASTKLEPSHVLKAIKLPEQDALSVIRFVLGRSTTAQHIDAVLTVLPRIVQELRSPRLRRSALALAAEVSHG